MRSGLLGDVDQVIRSDRDFISMANKSPRQHRASPDDDTVGTNLSASSPVARSQPSLRRRGLLDGLEEFVASPRGANLVQVVACGIELDATLLDDPDDARGRDAPCSKDMIAALSKARGFTSGALGV